MIAARLSPLVLVAILAAHGGHPVRGAQEMPNPRQMSGIPLPVGDVARGTVTVRVLRGSFTSPVASQTVELTGGSTVLRAATNEEGRAEFTGLQPGTRWRATAAVGGERLESQEFELPASGGIRLMLVAADGSADTVRPEAAASSAAAAAGEVMLGEESRFIFEMGEDGMSVFYVLQLVNRSAAPVQPPSPLVLELPAEARRPGLLEGSSPQAVLAGNRLEVAGPFAPGATVVQVGYTVPLTSPEVVLEQRLPVPLTHVAVVAQKLGDMQLSSPQMAEQRTMPAQGNLYIAGRGPGRPAGEVMRFHFTSLPHHPTWPRNLALLLAALVLAAGAWAALGARPAVTARTGPREQLQQERDRLFEQLADLEREHRAGQVSAEGYASRRQALVGALERVYASLDDGAALGRAS